MRKYLIINDEKISRDDCITSNANLVNMVIKKYFSWTDGLKYRHNKLGTSVFTYDDLYQEGLIGLIKAVDTFDNKRKTHFSSFAVKYIIRRITWSLMHKGFGMIRLPYNVYVAKKKLDKKYGNRSITYSELFERGEISATMYGALLCIMNCKNYEQLEDSECFARDNTVVKSLLETEQKENAIKILWIATNIVFKKNVDRNYHVSLWRAGLNGTDEVKTFDQISKLSKQTYGKREGEMSAQRAKKIADKIFKETRSLLNNGVVNDLIR